MAILIACEESQAVCNAFRARGFEAYSADIQPCSGGHPEWHIQGDVLPLLKESWDLVIAHPPCTYLSNAGAVHFKQGRNLERMGKMRQGREFFMGFFNANSDYIAIENPVPISYARLPRYSQIIQPWMFGDEYAKATCLWLTNLPVLVPTDIVGEGEKYIDSNGKSRGTIWCNQIGMPRKDRAKNRSKTFPGIAAAMAQQWGDVLLGKNYAPQSRILEQVKLW